MAKGPQSHKSVCKGKRVLVILRDGTRFTDRFVEGSDRMITLAKRGKLPVTKLRALSIYKAQPEANPVERNGKA